MSDLTALDQGQLENWLNRAGISHYICDQCHGLHLSGLQELDGVADSRLFVEPWGLLLSTELVIRPVALLPIVGGAGSVHSSTARFCATMPAIVLSSRSPAVRTA